MKRIFLLPFLFLIACGENHSQTNKTDKIDYKVVQLDFNYLNYLDNIKPKDDIFPIKSRSLIIVDCTTDNYKVDGKEVSKSIIRDEIKNQLANNKSNENFPVFEKNEYAQLGEIEHPKNYVLMLLVKPDINFVEYQDIRKEVFTAINDLRNKLSVEKTGKNLYELNKSNDKKELEIYDEIYRIYPMNYTETVLK
ncbi:MAG TPA: hypothetical protein ENH91_02055 [Leeuwenhoekiella sp.]|nr:hypothetical protein [Leeuwenhoekiella sp.]